MHAALFARIPGILTSKDLDFLKQVCKGQMRSRGIPCFSLLEHLSALTFRTIQQCVDNHAGETACYLNDFYLNTDSTFRTSWHVVTELFAFGTAVNAWVLLSPKCGVRLSRSSERSIISVIFAATSWKRMAHSHMVTTRLVRY